MTYEDMKEFAMSITGSTDEIHPCRYRDIFYNPYRKVFLHRASSAKSKVATEWGRGKAVQGWITNSTIHIGRYSVDVNPDWIVEDLQNV